MSWLLAFFIAVFSPARAALQRRAWSAKAEILQSVGISERGTGSKAQFLYECCALPGQQTLEAHVSASASIGSGEVSYLSSMGLSCPNKGLITSLSFERAGGAASDSTYQYSYKCTANEGLSAETLDALQCRELSTPPSDSNLTKAMQQEIKEEVLPLEVGSVENDNTEWVSVKTGSFSKPVVIGGVPDMRGSDEAIVRIRNVQPGSFELRLDEPVPCRDQWHVRTPIDWLVVEAGVHTLDTTLPCGVKMAAGTVSVAGNKKFVEVPFPPDAQFMEVPILLVQVQTYSTGRVFVKQRVKDLSPTAFKIALETQGSDLKDPKNPANFGEEVVGWVAFSHPHNSELDSKPVGATMNGGITPAALTEKPYTIDFGSSIPGAHFFASIVTYNGHHAAQLRVDERGDDGAQIFIQEETCTPLDMVHPKKEKVAWIVIGPLVSNSPSDEVGGWWGALANHHLLCENDEGLSGFQLQTTGQGAEKIFYKYTCCQHLAA
ncbi:unnamed protein product [Vitrella brassicaformis CCMP3155]|uniref:Uncharacterized protein n=1 Tax=Vitrella brassicaformis (strain CCMP3155) TaxID=1169540 RepID=A0A0G4FFV5_VITBC|nr:unnamed protein product [Vitrella brassicaformis CCMP3155]|eukprot:CEM11734.1 unnamed protein product [Vitrella brassicaformis CCMP3155]